MRPGLTATLLHPDHRRLLAAGLLLRLVLMPISMHSDLLDQYWRAHFLSHHGVVNLPGFLFERYAFPAAPLLVLDSLHGAYLMIVRPLLPDIHSLFTDRPDAMVVVTDLESHRRAILHFLSGGAFARWALFVFKLPYLLLDYLALGLLLRMVDGPRERRRLVAFWMFNFVTLFTLYMWGRYEVLTSTIALTALVQVQASRPMRAALFLGMAAATKYYPALLLPAWIPAAGERAIARLRFAVLFLLPVAAVGLLGLALSPPRAGRALLASGYQLQNVLRMTFDLGDVFWKEAVPLYPFVVVWTLLALADLRRRRGDIDAVVGGSLAYLMSFYALCAFSPQYFYWCVPFVALTLRRGTEVMWAHIIQAALFVLALLELGSDLVNLFAPLAPGLVSAPLQPRYAPQWREAYPVALGLARSAFSGLCLWIAWRARFAEESGD